LATAAGNGEEWLGSNKYREGFLNALVLIDENKSLPARYKTFHTHHVPSSDATFVRQISFGIQLHGQAHNMKKSKSASNIYIRMLGSVKHDAT